jgi:hypothetical protein
MRLLFKLSGAALFMLSVMWLISNYKLFDLVNKGKLVKMLILEKPRTCLGTRTKYNMKLTFQGQVFIKQVASSICDQYQTGDSIEMRYSNGINQVLYPEESFTTDYVLGTLLACSGVMLTVYGYKKKDL